MATRCLPSPAPTNSVSPRETYYYFSQSRKTTRSWPVICDSSGQQWMGSSSEATPPVDTLQHDFYHLNNSNNPNHQQFQYPADNTTASTSGSNQKKLLYFDQIEPLGAYTDDNHNTIGGGGGMNNNSPCREEPNSFQSQPPSSGAAGGPVFASHGTTCSPSPNPVTILFLTLLMTTSATAMLCAAIMTNYWELVKWDPRLLRKLTNESRPATAPPFTLEWLIGDKVARIPPGKLAPSEIHRFLIRLK